MYNLDVLIIIASISYILILTFGTSVILYFVELLGVIKTKRNKKQSVVLLVLVFVLMILVLYVKAFPMSFPLRLVVLFITHQLTFIGVITYELMGLALFLAIGTRSDEDVNGVLLADGISSEDE